MQHLKAIVLFVILFQATPPGLMAQGPATLTDRYRAVAGQLIGAAMIDEEGWEKLTYLTTQIGHRLSGSPQLEQAIEWAAARMREEGLENVTLQPVQVPHWVRGRESAEVVSPIQRNLSILGLGGSIGTPSGGIQAPVVVVGSFDELESLGRERVEGKIVLFAVPWVGYGRASGYRGNGASAAARLGAVAALVRSATGHSLYTPHTGAMRYADDAPRIPAASVTVEDAEWIRRMTEAGREVTVKLSMEARTFPDALSANVIAEIPGSDLPHEIVVMGGHLDSWDVGQGAHDDGAGVMAAWQALTLVHRLGLRPRRTLRVVLWTNEENGQRGGQVYHEALGDDVLDHVAAIEMDGGAERPVGFGVGLGEPADQNEPHPALDRAVVRAREIGRLLDGLEAGTITRGGGGADIYLLRNEGVPSLNLRTVGEHYFDWHHSHADTLDKVDVQHFRKAVAMLAVMGYVLADMPGRLTDDD